MPKVEARPHAITIFFETVGAIAALVGIIAALVNIHATYKKDIASDPLKQTQTPSVQASPVGGETSHGDEHRDERCRTHAT